MQEFISNQNLLDLWSELNDDDQEGFTRIQNQSKSRLDRLYVQQESLMDPTISILPNFRAKGDHFMLSANLRNLPRSKAMYKHPDYLLDDYKFKQHIDNTIREFLIIHSTLAEEYFLAPNIPDEHEKPNEVSMEGGRQGTSPLTRQHIDISMKIIQRKFDN
jgi:hypothetical protein